MMINLGVGLPRGYKVPQQPQDADVDDDVNDEEEDAGGANEAGENEDQPAGEVMVLHEPDDTQILLVVVEELYERFPGEEGQEQIQKILETMKQEFDHAHSIHASANGHTGGDADVDGMDVS